MLNAINFKMRVALGLSIFLAWSVLASQSSEEIMSETEVNAESAVIETRLGMIQGLNEDGVLNFRGIRYADSPIGANRFLRPQPAPAWRGTFDATSYQNRCMQVNAGFLGEPIGATSEDCLFLNVATQSIESNGRPVLVWIHGGGFVNGSGNEYNGSELVKQGDVVFVSINYRLGLFGFLDLAEHGDHLSGSASNGIRDMIAALNWVKQNISDYGGDPSNVTIFGESAGGSSVLLLLAAPEADGLYHKAIAHSPGASEQPPANVATPLLESIGGESADFVSRLRKLSASELLRLQGTLPGVGGAIDGVVVTRTPNQAIEERGNSGVPIVAGSNRDEGKFFTALFKAFDPAGEMPLLQMASQVLAGADAKNYIERLKLLHQDADQDEIFEHVWNALFRKPSIGSVSHATEAGPGGWLYQFDLPATKKFLGSEVGATHAAEIVFTFNRFKSDDLGPLALYDPQDPAVLNLAQRWSDTVLAFAKHGNPNGAGLPEWPKYDRESRLTMVLDSESRIDADLNAAERNLWEDESAQVRY